MAFPDTHNTVPSASATFTSDNATFLKEEDAERFNEILSDFVVQGGLHPTAGGLTGTFTTAPLIAYAGGFRISDATVSLTYTDASTTWVIAHKDITGNLDGVVGTFIRSGSTHYLTLVSGSTPTLPAGAVWLMKVTTSGGAITTVQDLRLLNSVANSLGFVGVKTLGALGDGNNDDTTAIQAVLDSVRSVVNGPTGLDVGAIVVWPPGDYKITGTLNIPTLVSMLAIGKVRITSGAVFSPMVSVDETNLDGNRYGNLEGFFLDGNNTSAVGLYVGLSVERSYRNISIENCLDAGMVVDGAQNNKFDGIDTENNGLAASAFGSGIRLNHGAGNNQFSRCEVNANIPYQLIILDNATVDDATKDAGTFPAGPSGNTFWKCIFERPDDTDGINQIYIRAGRYNEFYGSTISATALTSARVGVRITMEDRAAPISTAHTRFTGGDYSGSSGFVTGFSVEGFSSGIGHELFVDGMFFENMLTAFASDADSRIAIGPGNDIGGSVTNRYLGSGAIDTVTWALKARHKVRCVRATTSELAFTAEVDGDSQARYRVLASGAVEWAPATVDGFNNPTLQRISIGSNHAAMRFSDPLAIENTTAAVYAGTGTPESSQFANVGSIYLRTDGSSATSVYVKETGGFSSTGWVAVMSTPTTGSAAPTSNATFVGQIFVDTTADDAYIAIQTGTGATDWKKATP